MKRMGFGSVALVISMSPAMSLAQGAPQVVTSQVVRQAVAPSSNAIEDAAKAAAAAAAAARDRKPAEAGHTHMMPQAVAPSSTTSQNAVTTIPATAGHVHVVQTQASDHPLTYDYRDVEQGDVTYQGRWTGTWTGHYEGQPTQVYNGTYDGRYGGSVPHRSDRDGRGRVYYGSPGYYYSYGWGAPMMTTVTFQSAPIVTTTTTTTEEVIYGAAPRKRIARRSWKPRPKQRCAC